MAFLNKKERVLDVQLTHYGRRLLSEGRLKPVYYAFFDDDVAYDSKYLGYEQDQNDIQGRIQDSVRFAAQGSFTTIENQDRGGDAKGPGFMLGTSDSYSQEAPAFRLSLFNGEIDSSTVQNTGSSFDQFIPQINMEIEHEISPETNYKLRLADITLDQSFFSRPFPDDSFLLVEEDLILLRLEEINGISGRENFTVEVYQVEENNGQEVLKPLEFSQQSPDEGPILSDEEPGHVEPTPADVEYYLNIVRDTEIPADILCRYLDRDNANNFFGRPIICREEEDEPRGLYDSDVTEEDVEC